MGVGNFTDNIVTGLPQGFVALCQIEAQHTDVLFDGYARVVTRLLPEACQAVEERALAAVGIAHDGNGRLGMLANTDLIRRNFADPDFSQRRLLTKRRNTVKCDIL